MAADEPGAVVGLPGEVAQIDAAAGQVVLDALGKDGAGGGGAPLGKGEKQQAAADLAGGVLNGREAGGLGLWPVLRDVVEVFGVGADWLEQPPGGFDGG